VKSVNFKSRGLVAGELPTKQPRASCGGTPITVTTSKTVTAPEADIIYQGPTFELHMWILSVLGNVTGLGLRLLLDH
jgi:hypothetical protein